MEQIAGTCEETKEEAKHNSEPVKPVNFVAYNIKNVHRTSTRMTWKQKSYSEKDLVTKKSMRTNKQRPSKIEK